MIDCSVLVQIQLNFHGATAKVDGVGHATVSRQTRSEQSSCPLRNLLNRLGLGVSVVGAHILYFGLGFCSYTVQ